MTRTPRARDHETHERPAPSAPGSDAALQEQIEGRLATVEPEVEVLAVERAGSRRSPTLRVYLDRPGGVDLDLCARVTHHLRDLLSDFGVEVSSPGPERPLSKPEHYERYLGHRARVRTTESIDGRNDFKGDLVGVDDEGVTLAADWGMVRIPHARIRRSNLMQQHEGSRRAAS
jgi:ribosome maturation factor RimP